MIHAHLFPNLRPGSYTITSPADSAYNCVAWAVGDDQRWWEPAPNYYWPTGVPLTDTVAAHILVLGTVGYLPCPDGSAEVGFEKIAIYGNNGIYEHAARQLLGGSWTSKMGPDEDIEHDSPLALEGGPFGSVVCFVRRAIPNSS